MDIILLGLIQGLKSQIANVASGITGYEVNGLNLIIKLKDGSQLTMTFPAPAEIDKVEIKPDASGKSHLWFSFKDGQTFDAGELPGGGGGGGANAELTEQITSNVAVGAAAAGAVFNQGLSFTDFAKKILLKENAPTITFTVDGKSSNFLKEQGTIYEDVKLQVVINNKGTASAITDIKFKVNGAVKDTQTYDVSNNTYSYQLTETYTSNTTFSIDVTYKDSSGTSKNVTKSVTVQFVYPNYIGKVDASTFTVDENDIKTLTKLVLGTKGYTYNNVTLNNEKFCYAYPKSYGDLVSIKDNNNFEYIGSYDKAIVKVDGADYNVYILKDPVSGSGFKQVYG